MARPHRLGGWGVQPSPWLELTVLVWGMATPNGASLQAGGTGSPTKPLVAENGLWNSCDPPQALAKMKGDL